MRAVGVLLVPAVVLAGVASPDAQDPVVVEAASGLGPAPRVAEIVAEGEAEAERSAAAWEASQRAAADAEARRVAEAAARQARRAQRADRTQRAPAGSGDVLARIKACESGGDYRAVSRSGKYSGAYQADRGTWGGYGGYDRAGDAPPEVQDAWARELMAKRGTQPWPTCRHR